MENFITITFTLIALFLVLECSDPYPVENATVLTKEPYNPGDMIKYICDEGYEVIVGNLQRQCGLDGKFTGDMPICACRLRNMSTK